MSKTPQKPAVRGKRQSGSRTAPKVPDFRAPEYYTRDRKPSVAAPGPDSIQQGRRSR